jgi:hypothetical protein
MITSQNFDLVSVGKEASVVAKTYLQIIQLGREKTSGVELMISIAG